MGSYRFLTTDPSTQKPRHRPEETVGPRTQRHGRPHLTEIILAAWSKQPKTWWSSRGNSWTLPRPSLIVTPSLSGAV